MSEPQKCDICGEARDHPKHRSEKWVEGTHCFTVNTRNPVPPYSTGNIVVKHLGEGQVDVTFAYIDQQDGQLYRVVALGRRQAVVQGKEAPGDPCDGGKTA